MSSKGSPSAKLGLLEFPCSTCSPNTHGRYHKSPSPTLLHVDTANPSGPKSRAAAWFAVLCSLFAVPARKRKPRLDSIVHTTA